MTNEIKNILDKYPSYEATIGIEVHVQLKTESKIFCSCPNRFGDEPNKNICPICAGYPGTLPTLNKKVVDFAIMAGVATNSDITAVSKFARKHYMYPDLPKNFQITQGSAPICTYGYVTIDLNNGTEKKIGLTRIHIEEDAGKTIHEINKSLVDLNRAGTPLLEIVSEPDISDAYEAKAYLSNLRAIVQHLNISNANMEEGSFRADVNISVKKKADKELGTRAELKNINSFKFITQAIDYEIIRQIELLESNKKVLQETRLWDTKNHKTVFMRSKEEAADYRYLREPDLPLIIVHDEWINEIKESMPELPRTISKRFQNDYNLSSYEAENLITDVTISNFFENTVKVCNNPKQVCNWILRNVLAFLNDNKIKIEESKINAEKFAELIKAISDGVINTKVAQDIFLELAQTGKSPNQIIKDNNLEQIGSEDELEKIIVKIVKDNADQVEKYKSGNDRLFGYFVGQAMKATQGKANPKILQKLLKENLK